MAACRYGNFLLVFNLISSSTLKSNSVTSNTHVLSSIYTSDKQYPRDLKLHRRYCVFTGAAHWKMRGSFFTNRQKGYLLHASFSKTERKPTQHRFYRAERVAAFSVVEPYRLLSGLPRSLYYNCYRTSLRHKLVSI